MNIYSIPPLLTLCCFLGLVVLTSIRGLWRRQWAKANILFLIICIFCSFLNIDILFAFNTKSAKAALFVSRIDHLFIVFSMPVFIQFFHTYLKTPDRKWLVYLAYAYSAFLACLIPSPLYIESMQKDIFKPFFTTKAVGKGTGLGLHICHEIVQKHGGVLSLEETDKQGTCFVMRLP